MATLNGGVGQPIQGHCIWDEGDRLFLSNCPQAVVLGVLRSAGADLCTWGVGLFGLRNRECKRLKADAIDVIHPSSLGRRKEGRSRHERRWKPKLALNISTQTRKVVEKERE